MTKEVPEKLQPDNTARLLRIQNAMCTQERATIGCQGIACNDCILNADLGEFKLWLNEVTK